MFKMIKIIMVMESIMLLFFIIIIYCNNAVIDARNIYALTFLGIYGFHLSGTFWMIRLLKIINVNDFLPKDELNLLKKDLIGLFGMIFAPSILSIAVFIKNMFFLRVILPALILMFTLWGIAMVTKIFFLLLCLAKKQSEKIMHN